MSDQQEIWAKCVQFGTQVYPLFGKTSTQINPPLEQSTWLHTDDLKRNGWTVANHNMQDWLPGHFQFPVFRHAVATGPKLSGAMDDWVFCLAQHGRVANGRPVSVAFYHFDVRGMIVC